MRADPTRVQQVAFVLPQADRRSRRHDSLARTRSEDRIRRLGDDRQSVSCNPEAGGDRLARRFGNREQAGRLRQREALLRSREQAGLRSRNGQVGELEGDRVVNSHHGRRPDNRKVRVDRRKQKYVRPVTAHCDHHAEQVSKAAMGSRGCRLRGSLAELDPPGLGAAGQIGLAGRYRIDVQDVGGGGIALHERPNGVAGESTVAAPVDPARRVHAHAHRYFTRRRLRPPPIA